MPLSLRIISSPEGEVVSEWTKVFPEDGGSIGRSYGSVLQLPDSSRSISGTHVIINRGSRGYQVMDVSTNGLFINGSKQALGKNNSASLNDGDVLDLGQYRLMASCFVPEKASIKPTSVQTESALGEWNDDPFAQGEPVLQAPQQASTEYRNAGVSAHDAAITEATRSESILFESSGEAVDPDPFTEVTPEQSIQREWGVSDELNDESIDEDPFMADKTQSLDNEQIPSRMQTPRVQRYVETRALEPQQMIAAQANQQEIIMQAVEMAFGRMMEEISPTHLEDMFKDLTQPSFFSRKPNYWEMYKRYFQRQQDNKDWQLKFKAYFSESLRMKQSFGDKTDV